MGRYTGDFEFGFKTIDADRDEVEVFEDIKNEVDRLVADMRGSEA